MGKRNCFLRCLFLTNFRLGETDKAFNAYERTDMYVFLESEKPPRKHFSHNWTQKSVIKTRGRTSKTEQKISIRVLFKLLVLSLDSLDAYFISVLSVSIIDRERSTLSSLKLGVPPFKSNTKKFSLSYGGSIFWNLPLPIVCR